MGVSSADEGVFWFRALWLDRARTTVGPSATLRSEVMGVRQRRGEFSSAHDLERNRTHMLLVGG